MSITLDHKPDINIEVSRCYNCARWYGFEKFSPEAWRNCPHCMQRERDKISADNARLRRAVAALKGAFARLRGMRS